MDRRRFLSLLGKAALGTAASGSVLDPEKALWIPGQKRIFDFGGLAIPSEFVQLLDAQRDYDRLHSALVDQAIQRLAVAIDAEALALSNARADLGLVAGDQWPRSATEIMLRRQRWTIGGGTRFTFSVVPGYSPSAASTP